MQRIKRGLLASAVLPVLLIPAIPANAAIHEIVAAYCNGGDVGVTGADGFLEPPGVTDPTKESFRKPPSASGAVVGGLTTDKANVKFEAGQSPNPMTLGGFVDHPSAEHCPGAAVFPD